MPNLPDLSNIPKRRLVILASLLLIGGVTFIVIRSNLQSRIDVARPKAELTMWGVLSADEMDLLNGGYTAKEPGVTLTYTQIPKEQYETRLLNALASGQGPDIVMIHNHNLTKEADKLVPAPQGVVGLATVQDLYPRVVEEEFIDPQGAIYALPIYLDTLALFYNKELLDQAGIAELPKTWEEFQAMIPKLRELKNNGQIVRAAAALGGSAKTVPTGIDLLQLLLLQNGALSDLNGDSIQTLTPSFANGAGENAFNFYLSFGNSGSSVYTWNDGQGDYLESFSAGKTAMIFDYRDRMSEIKRRAPFLKFGVAAMPQLTKSASVNYPDYWGLAVSKQSKFPNEAWGFIADTLTDQGLMQDYMQNAGRPPALRTLIGLVADIPEVGVFAKQALTARSWRQADEVAIRDIFSRGIVRVTSGQTSPFQALNEIQDQVGVLANQIQGR